MKGKQYYELNYEERLLHEQWICAMCCFYSMY